MKVKMLGKVGLAITRTVGKTKLWTKIHKPEILVGVGIAAGVAAIVTAAVQGTKCKAILEELDENLEEVEAAKEYAEIDGVKYTEEDQRRDRAAYKLQAASKVAKTMAVPMALGGVMVVSTVLGFNEEKNRYERMAGAFVGVCGTFAAYRGRCKSKFGEAADKYCLTGLEEKEVEVTTYDENGKAVVEKKMVNDGEIAEDARQNLFSFEFSPRTSTLATYDVTTNIQTLQQVENSAHIHMVEYWSTNYNWIKSKAQLDRKLYPPTEYGEMFGATCHNNKDGMPIRKIHLNAHAIPGREDGAIFVIVEGMLPMIDPKKDITKALGEAPYKNPVPEDWVSNEETYNFRMWRDKVTGGR